MLTNGRVLSIRGETPQLVLWCPHLLPRAWGRRPWRTPLWWRLLLLWPLGSELVMQVMEEAPRWMVHTMGRRKGPVWYWIKGRQEGKSEPRWSVNLEGERDGERNGEGPPSRVVSDSGTASCSSGAGLRKPEGNSDTSLSMEVDEDDVSLAADRSTRSWITDSPSFVGSSSSSSSAECRSPSQRRMPLRPVPLTAKLLAANGHLSRGHSSGGGSGGSTVSY